MTEKNQPVPSTSAGVDDALLLAYVDGSVAPAVRERIEAAMLESEDVAQRVALLRASELPYREAFEQQTLPPVPEALTRKIEALVAAQHGAAPSPAEPRARTQRGAAPHRVHAPREDSPRRPSPVQSRSSRLRRAWPVVAAFAAGALCCALILAWPWSGHPAASLSPWLRAVVSYQALYTKATTADIAYSREQTLATLRRIRGDDGIDLHGVPDLSEAGLTFKRAERLNFNGKPLVQLLYQPRQGAPVALCVIAAAKPDELVAMREARDMAIVTWRRDKLGYALVGRRGGDVDLARIGQRIARNDVPMLL